MFQGPFQNKILLVQVYEKAGKMKKAIQYAKLGLDDAIKTGGPDGINTLRRLNDRLLSSK